MCEALELIPNTKVRKKVKGRKQERERRRGVRKEGKKDEVINCSIYFY